MGPPACLCPGASANEEPDNKKQQDQSLHCARSLPPRCLRAGEYGGAHASAAAAQAAKPVSAAASTTSPTAPAEAPAVSACS